jgi:hypothetical protein
VRSPAVIAGTRENAQISEQFGKLSDPSQKISGSGPEPFASAPAGISSFVCSIVERVERVPAVAWRAQGSGDLPP